MPNLKTTRTSNTAISKVLCIVYDANISNALKFNTLFFQFWNKVHVCNMYQGQTYLVCGSERVLICYGVWKKAPIFYQAPFHGKPFWEHEPHIRTMIIAKCGWLWRERGGYRAIAVHSRPPLPQIKPCIPQRRRTPQTVAFKPAPRRIGALQDLCQHLSGFKTDVWYCHKDILSFEKERKKRRLNISKRV